MYRRRMNDRENVARLLISCPDRHGIVAAVSGFLAASGANILSSDQHATEPEGGTFFMRMEFLLEGLSDRAPSWSGASRTRWPRRSRWTGGSPPRSSGSGWRSSPRAPTTACSTCSGAGGEASSTRTSSRSCQPPGSRGRRRRFGVPYYHVPVAPGLEGGAEARMLELLVARSTSSCSRATCRSSRATSSTGWVCR